MHHSSIHDLTQFPPFNRNKQKYSEHESEHAWELSYASTEVLAITSVMIVLISRFLTNNEDFIVLFFIFHFLLIKFFL